MEGKLINFIVNKEELQRFDAVAEMLGRTRTSILTELMRGFCVHQVVEVEKRNRKLEELARPKAKGSVSWKALGSAVAVSLTLGVLLARLTMMPVGVTTRGGPAEDQVSQRQLLTGSAPQVIALVVEDPKGYSLKVVEAALAAEIEVSAIRAGAKYQVVLEALISRTAIQSEVKKLLKLKEEASGNFTVILSPSSK